MKNQLNSITQKGITVGWSVFAGLILFILICFSQSVSYNGKKVFALPYWALLLIGIAAVSVGIALYCRWQGAVDRFTAGLPRYTILILTGALFLVQLVVFYNIFFETGWDSGYVVSIARRIGAGESGFATDYFGRYPNNIFLVWFYGVIFRVLSWLGLGAWDALAIMVLQSALACLCGYLLFQIMKDITKPTVAWVAWLVYVVHVGLHPWLMILYTDPLALCFPMIVLRLYQLTVNGKRVWVKWCGIAFFSYFGYKVKPQVIIVLIAIGLIEIVRFLSNVNRETVRTFAKKVCVCGGSGIAALLLFTQIVLPTMPFTYRTEAEFTLYHYFMMGLNTQYQGGYAPDDVNFSNSYYTVESRSDANKRVIRERLREMGVPGVTKQYARKVLINFGDGSYAWSGEGTFYNTTFEDRNHTLSPFLKDIYYRDGQYHTYFLHLQQLIWLILLMGSVGIGLYFTKRKDSAPVLAVPLALIGVTIFVTLFEARARYLFAFSPFFIIAGILGWVGIAQTVRRLIALRCRSL